MAGPNVFAMQYSNLNAFLYADVGTERNGMALSVLSMLARLDDDPWREASRLAGLPAAAATDALARAIANMPASIWPLPDATRIAARLVALLPSQTRGGDTGPTPRVSGWRSLLVRLGGGGTAAAIAAFIARLKS